MRIETVKEMIEKKVVINACCRPMKNFYKNGGIEHGGMGYEMKKHSGDGKWWYKYCQFCGEKLNTE